jgi:hypothetical protein
MSSVNAVPSGVADLLQTSSKTGFSALFSALSSTSVQSALATASSGDLVQLSQRALALQQVAGLFGSSDNSAATPTATNETLAQQEAAVLFGTNSPIDGGNRTISLLG